MHSPKPQHITGPNGRSLAYIRTESSRKEALGIVFLPGFRSDMMGSKATFLEQQCIAADIPYLRFDYSGHGQSGGVFAELTLSDWLADVNFLLDHVATGTNIIIGSSMGGWLGLRLAQMRPERVAAFIGIAAAPDFTRDITASLSDDHKRQMAEKGYCEEPNDYSDEPYIFTRALIEDGEAHCILDGRIAYNGPVRLLQGMADKDVVWQKALRIERALTSPDCAVTLIEDGNHSLSRESDLALLWGNVLELSAKLNNTPAPSPAPDLHTVKIRSAAPEKA